MNRERKYYDLIDYVKHLERRISNLETNQRINLTSIDSGELVIRNGDLVVVNADGTQNFRLAHGDVPQIIYYPIGLSSLRAAIFAFQYSGGIALQESIQTWDGSQDGGKLLLTNYGTWLSYQPQPLSDSNEAFLALSATNEPTGIWLQGTWLDGYTTNQYQALFTAIVDVGAGFSGVIMSYSQTMSGRMCPVPAVLDTGGASFDWCLTQSDNAGFTVSWSNTTAKTVYAWGFRLP